LVLANQQAETVTEARLSVVGTIISVRGGLGLIRRFGNLGSRSPAKLLDGTEADSVGLAEGAVDCAGFGNAEFATADQR
jgi:hypothetical protein